MMDRAAWKRFRAFKSLLHDGVRRGTDFVERHHRHAASKPFRALEAFPSITVPTRAVRRIHDGVLTLTYGGVRTIHRATEILDGWVEERWMPGADGGPEGEGEDGLIVLSRSLSRESE